MYLSVHEHPWCSEKGLVEILLDGRPVEKCLAAHEEEGWVDVHQVDVRGRLVIKDGDPVELRLHGRVEIRPINMSRADFERLLNDSFEAAIRVRIAHAEQTADREGVFFYEGVLEMYQRATQPGFTFANDDLERAYAEHLKRLEELRA